MRFNIRPFPLTSTDCGPNFEALKGGDTYGENILGVDGEAIKSLTSPTIPVKQKEILSTGSVQICSSNESYIGMDAEDIASHWLQDCLQNHDCGQEDTMDPVLPLRVIDVRGRRGRGDPFQSVALSGNERLSSSVGNS